MKPDISQELLHALFTYDPDTGVFIRRVSTSSRAREGQIAGCIDGDGYYLITVTGIQYRAHRLAWLYMYGAPAEGFIDHINHCRTDNRMSNLRVVTNADNLKNRARATKRNKLGVLGVSFNKRQNCFESCVHNAGRKVAVSYHDTLRAAAEWYLKTKKHIHPQWDATSYAQLIREVL